MNINEVLERLHSIADPEKIIFKRKKYAIISNNALGVTQKDLKAIAKLIGKDNELALELFETGIYECRILTSKVYNPKNISIKQMEYWASTFENWEICDSFSMDFFGRSPHCYKMIFEWASREEEFVKRSAFAMMAAYSSKHKNDSNQIFESFLPLIIREANDERNFVKKAVNWALRSIGKRNIDLRSKAVDVCDVLLKTDSKSAKWIATDAKKELMGIDVTMQDHPRSVYRG